jgi:gliding motility-associated-like protein
VGVVSELTIFPENLNVQVANKNYDDDYVCQECISVPEFTASATSLCANQAFQFTNTTSIGLKCFQHWVIDGQTFPGEENISYTFPQPGIYQVQLVSSCSNENNVFTMNIVVLAPCDDDNIDVNPSPDSNLVVLNEVYFVPNTFSPNGDEHNQRFNVSFSNPEFVSEFEFTIFNRWGEIIYFSKDLAQGWDGTYAKEESMAGVYSWKLCFNYRKQKYLENGRVSLIR